jgi:GR25 family glycosyltransferase involved in LPS biosynthesis
MIPLPICRWRKPHEPGQCVCESAKFPNPPNLVPESFCAECPYADHDVPAPLPKTLPCVHLEGVTAGTSADESGPVFACALHGRCIISEPDQSRSRTVRSCANCADYVGHDPFGPSSTQMLRQAETFLAALPKYPRGRYQGRGVVIAAGGERFFPSLYVTIRALRHVGCRLPIQVWYLGRNDEMPAQRKRLLAPYQVEFVDGDRVRRRHPARRLDGWELKIFATLHCPFEEVLFLDADSYSCRNPEFLLERADYRARGAIFWPDALLVDTRLKWSAYRVPDPRHLGSIESGQFVVNKALCWRPLNLAWHYNNYSDYYFRYCHGDKHTLEVAWERCACPYVMWSSKSPWDEVAYVQLGPDQAPLFVHRCRDKFRFDSQTYTTPQNYPMPMFHAVLPLERECWKWLGELARRTGNTLAHQKTTCVLPPSHKRRASGSRFAIAMLYTSEVASLGRRTARVMRAYARRHGYEAVVATASIDASRKAVWSKILLLHRYMLENPDCKWVLWLDADAVIMNPQRRLEELVDDDVDFVAAEDLPPSPMNAGVFLVRNCPATLDMLRRSYAKKHHVASGFQEQAAIFEALQEAKETVRSRIVSRRLLNSFAFEYQEGDFILHFAGNSPDAKLAGVKQALAWIREPRSGRSLSPLHTREVETVRDLLPSQPRANGHLSPALAAPCTTDLPPIFCITCAQTPKRTALARRHFRERGLNVHFFPGIHGEPFGLRTVLQSHNLMLEGHVGVLLSHYMLWQTLAYLPHEEILILEDDAWFEADFRARFRRAYDELPRDWQFVFVGAVRMKGKPVERLTDCVCVMRYPCGLHAYLVKRSVIPFLLQSNHQARLPLDYQLIENSLPAMKCYTFLPSLVKQRSARLPAEGTGENWPTTVGFQDER